MNHLLEVSGLETCFKNEGKEFPAIENVSFYLDPGEIIGIVGESGSGKSVTMLSCLQLISSPGRVSKGSVHLDGTQGNLLDYAADSEQMRSIRGGRISMIFQEPMTSLNPVLTIGYQISENIMLHLGLDKAQAQKRGIEMLKLVGIPDAEQRYSYYPHQFSGGMRQRIMIAMAMSSEPDVLIADEATTALDVTTQAQILELIRDVAKKTNTSVVLITHNLGVVARYAERIYVMYSGNVVEHASATELFAHPEHPYTRALLKAIPRLDDSKDRVLVPIKGLPPNPALRPAWCPFYERCDYRKDSCKEHQRHPELKDIAPNHQCACLLSEPEKAARAEELSQELPPKTVKAPIGDNDVIAVEGVGKFFPIYKGVMRRKVGEVKAIEDISFRIRRGETLGVVGESGCGKTTLARCIMRVYKPEAGTITFDGKNIAGLTERQLRPLRPKMAMVFQDPFSSLDPRQQAGSIVEEALRLNHLYDSESAYAARVDELFRIVGLDPSLKYRVAHEFSGGQRQRIGIARALSSNPDLIICDEPISALDVSIQAQIINLLERLQADLGVSYMFIAHDLAVVKHISDRVLVMYLGRIMEDAPAEELYEYPLHPYTQMLLSAVPVADPAVEATRDRIPIQGEVPSLTRRPEGCPFHDRCPHCTDRCRKETPGLIDAGKGHMVSCWNYAR